MKKNPNENDLFLEKKLKVTEKKVKMNQNLINDAKWKWQKWKMDPNGKWIYMKMTLFLKQKLTQKKIEW